MKITGKTADELHQEWMLDPIYAGEHGALEDEFSLAAALIEARSQAGLSQQDVAARMKTSQPAIARLEGGRQNASLKTLRQYARATGNRLKVSFEPLTQSAP